MNPTRIVLATLAFAALVPAFAAASTPDVGVGMERSSVTVGAEAADESVSATTPEMRGVPTYVRAPLRDLVEDAAAATEPATAAAPKPRVVTTMAAAVPDSPVFEWRGEETQSAIDLFPILNDDAPIESIAGKGSVARDVVNAVATSSSAPVTVARADAGRDGGSSFDASDSESRALRVLHATAQTERLARLALPTEAPTVPLTREAPAAAPPTIGDAAPEQSARTASVAADAPSSAVTRAALVAAAASAAALPIALAAWALYHRIRGRATLENATRRRIFDAVTGSPGIGVAALANGAGVTYATADYHLARLESEGMLVRSVEEGRVRWYVNGGDFNASERKLIPLLENEEALRVLELVRASPGTYRAALAQRLGVTATAVAWHLKRLAALGLVTERREGRTAHVSVDEARLRADLEPLAAKLDARPAAARAAARLLGRGPELASRAVATA